MHRENESKARNAAFIGRLLQIGGRLAKASQRIDTFLVYPPNRKPACQSFRLDTIRLMVQVAKQPNKTALRVKHHGGPVDQGSREGLAYNCGIDCEG
ncbi:hypothetical protein CO661_30760 [Sinorhizobium fredii]|uniref:Uncharacterized protein n=2 Tax=Rhizobium fredii TaxID=380 RepID=A0A2A6LNF1_RHIFR|nr:hypothetical protein [Sinorhizobium fredii]PDT44173.1 hypothetical protein CO661_30760 [Sinorhizobium fredii]